VNTGTATRPRRPAPHAVHESNEDPVSDIVDAGVPERPNRGGQDDKLGYGARLALFYRQVVSELRKVVWPTRRELLTYTWVVIVFVTVVAIIVAALDLGFAKLVLKVFGDA
jgi:preprotein translocase subunit SecE